ncbi:MAG: hypothetical protein MPJ50_01860 [Pirellulales bacterium]|nr:hypothetical protein [Pirellulales bacterium]
MLFATKSQRAVGDASHHSAATDQNRNGQPTTAQHVESLLEFATSAGLCPRVDADAGILHGVKVLGLFSRNGRRYRTECVSAAAHLYEGIKVNVNHANGSRRAPRDYQDRLGCLREVRATEQGLFADLHFNPRHTVAEQLIWDAEHAPENVGLSHNVEARTSRDHTEVIVEEILHVNCVDLVADPATTAGLFEAHEPPNPAKINWQQMEQVVEELRRHRPELFSPVEASPQVEPLSHSLRTGAESPEFAQLLEGVTPELATALRQERAAWNKRLFTAGRPKSKSPAGNANREWATVRDWVRRIT